MPEPALAGRVVAVMGAAGALGPSVVAALSARGAHVAAVGRGEESLAGVVAAAERPGGAEPRVADLADAHGARALAEALVGAHGRVDAVVHLVGGYAGNGPLAEVSDADWEALERPLLRTVLNVTRAFAEPLKASGRGRFLMISSTQARQPSSGNAIYAATKAAAEAWTLALADELRESGSGATANVLVVKAIVTPAMRAAKPDAPFRIHTPAEDVAEWIALAVGDAGGKMNGQRIELHS